MFEFITKIIVKIMYFFSCNALKAVPVKCVSIINQECRIRPEIINIDSNEPIYYPYSIKVNKCSDSCNNLNDPYSKLDVPDVVIICNYMFLMK